MHKLIRWMIFGVLIALVPLTFSYVALFMKGAPNLAKVLGNGELLIVISAFCAGGVGELLGSGEEYPIAKTVAGGFTLLVLIMSALVFVSVVDSKLAGAAYHENTVATVSYVMFAFGFISCASCVGLSET